jgi:hypothetical protein
MLMGKYVKLQRVFQNFHWFGTVILLLMVIPLFRFAHLPLHFDWLLYLESFWGFNLLLASTLAFTLHALQWPETSFDWINRPTATQRFPFKTLFAIYVPSMYFFAGFVLVLCYNDIIAAIRFDGSHDLVLNRLDSYLLFGTTVTRIAHWTLRNLPDSVRYIASFVYLLTSPVVSAGIIFLTLREGRNVAMRFVGCMLTAYYLSLIIFYILPTTGPYYVCPIHSSGLKPLLELFRLHGRPDKIRLDYFIGFPSMHIGAPTILLWYIRSYKKSAAFLAVLLAFLVPSIIILEEHYILDILGGWGVALLAIAFVEWRSLRNNHNMLIIHTNLSSTIQEHDAIG